VTSEREHWLSITDDPEWKRNHISDPNIPLRTGLANKSSDYIFAAEATPIKGLSLFSRSDRYLNRSDSRSTGTDVAAATCGSHSSIGGAALKLARLDRPHLASFQWERMSSSHGGYSNGSSGSTAAP